MGKILKVKTQRVPKVVPSVKKVSSMPLSSVGQKTPKVKKQPDFLLHKFFGVKGTGKIPN